MYGYLMKLALSPCATSGGCLRPFMVPVLARLETLPLRRTHVANAVGWRAFSAHPRRSKASVRGHPERPTALVDKYSQEAGAVLPSDVRGGREAGQRLIASLRLWSHLATSAREEPGEFTPPVPPTVSSANRSWLPRHQWRHHSPVLGLETSTTCLDWSGLTPPKASELSSRQRPGAAGELEPTPEAVVA